MISTEVEILLVEDSQDDADLALHALRRGKLTNNIYHAQDGEEALDFLFCRGAHPQTTQNRRHPGAGAN
jgi:two-component system response regulator